MSVPLDPAGTETLVSRLGEPEQMIVRGVLDWLLPEEGGLVDLTQSTLQDFLWYHLPVKWLIDTREHTRLPGRSPTSSPRQAWIGMPGCADRRTPTS